MKRNFNHKKIFQIVWNIAYVISFITLMAYTISNARNNSNYTLESSQENFYGNEDWCENCDEID